MLYAVTVTLTFSAENAEQAQNAAYSALDDAFADYELYTGQPEDFPELAAWTYDATAREVNELP